MSDNRPDWLKDLTDEEKIQKSLKGFPVGKPMSEPEGEADEKKAGSYVHRRMNPPTARPKK